MRDDVAIRVHNLHKSFELAENKQDTLKHILVNPGKRAKKHRQKVLNGIDFEIKKGEFFGIVGRNGSGKSTLLKLLAGVYTPDSGAVEVNGNLTPFIELGVGFNPELSGKDNVYLSAALLGYTRKQVNAIYDEIVEFAELQDHMDKKLKNYSSGMQVRLAFSIAIKAKNDILIFDEVLAVGDEAFQQKCTDVFEKYKAMRQTVVIVTHDMNAVRKFCSRALLIDGGKITSIGNTQKVTEFYRRINEQANGV
jgi:ABC-2 type transport system ATP-binding protein